MCNRHSPTRVPLFIPLLLIPLASVAAAQSMTSAVGERFPTRWRVETLPPLGEPSYGYAFGVNAAGQVVGCSDNQGQVHAVLWEPEPTGTYRVVDLGTLGGAYSCAYAINGWGMVVGESTTASGASFACAWYAGKIVELGSLLTIHPTFPANYSFARSVNDLGLVVGASYADDNVYRAFLWKEGQMLDLGSLGPMGNRSSQALDLNERGEIVGWSTMEEGNGAVVWGPSGLRPLGGETGEASALNEHGEIVGQRAGPSGTDAFLTHKGVVVPFGSEGTLASDVNEAGAIVGQKLVRVDPSSGERIFSAYLREGGRPIVLPQPEFARHAGASSLNDQGVIVGHILTREYLPQPVLWRAR